MTDKAHDSKSGKADAAADKPKNPAEHAEHLDGPMSDDAMHKTESKVDHPMGKTRHGGRGG